jgi:hypothetical protein
VNARRTPKQILNAHPPDQRPQVRIDLRADLQKIETSSASSSENRHDAERTRRAE